MAVIRGTPSSAHCSPKVSKGEEIESGHAGARDTKEHPPPGAVDGRLGQAWDKAGEGRSAAPASSDGDGARKMLRGGKWQDLSKKISNQLRARNGPLEFAALSRWQGPCSVVPGCRAGEWAEHGMDVETSTMLFGCELVGCLAAC